MAVTPTAISLRFPPLMRMSQSAVCARLRDTVPMLFIQLCFVGCSGHLGEVTDAELGGSADAGMPTASYIPGAATTPVAAPGTDPTHGITSGTSATNPTVNSVDAPMASSPGSDPSAPVGATSSPPTSGTTALPTPLFDCSETSAHDPGPAPLLRLSRSEYIATVRDLVGDVSGLTDSFKNAIEPSALGLKQPDVAVFDLEQYQDAANRIAASVVSDANKVRAIAPCPTDADVRSCAEDFVRTFASKAYRAPVTDADDVEAHLALFDAGAVTSPEHGLELMLRGILQSPRFLYHVEIGTSEQVGSGAVKLSAYELAARLSYRIWGTPPDEELLDAATNGELDDSAGISTQLSRLLEDPRGATLVRRFLEEWIQLSSLNTKIKNDQIYPEWNDTLRDAIQAQARAFFDDILQNQDGSLTALLTAPEVFADERLVPYYESASGDSWTAIAWNPSVTSGLLTLPALLALQSKPDESSPIYRGKFVRESLFCQQLPTPPADIPKAPEVTPGVSARERLAQHEADPKCSDCHQLMDPIGFGFENYDGIGRYRTEDGGEAVSALGEIIGAGEIDGPFTGITELGERLAQSSLVKECIARQWFRFMLKRFEQPVDNCSMQSVLDGYLAADASLNALPQALVETDAFRYRRPQ